MIAYIVASIVCLLASLIGGGITLVISQVIGGVHAQVNADDHETPIGAHTYNWVQCIGTFSRTICGSSAALWCLTWFSKEPSLIFFVALGILGLCVSLSASTNFRPIAQACGTILGQIVFYVCIW